MPCVRGSVEGRRGEGSVVVFFAPVSGGALGEGAVAFGAVFGVKFFAAGELFGRPPSEACFGVGVGGVGGVGVGLGSGLGVGVGGLGGEGGVGVGEERGASRFAAGEGDGVDDGGDEREDDERGGDDICARVPRGGGPSPTPPGDGVADLPENVRENFHHDEIIQRRRGRGWAVWF